MDRELLLRAVDVAHSARSQGNHPFGAVLADANGKYLAQAENSVVTSGDCTAHAEMNLVRESCQRFDKETLSHCTIYASTEPCAMCGGAIYWSGIGHVVFGVDLKALSDMIGTAPGLRTGDGMPLALLLQSLGADTTVTGPIPLDEAVEVHRGFWSE